MRLSEAIEALAIATRANGRSPRTVQAYREKLRPLLAFLGDVDVASITTADLRRFVASLMEQTTTYRDHPHRRERDRPLSEFTIAGHVRALKRLFRFLADDGIITASPAQRIRTPQPKRDRPKGMANADLLRLLATCDGGSALDRRDKALILLLADTACRVSGLCGLRLGDLNLDQHRAIVTEKGSKARVLFFTEPTARALASWLAVRPADRGDAVFVGLGPRSQGPLSASSVAKVLTMRGRRAGVSGPVNPHSLRHAFARDYLTSGGDLATLSDILGHTSVAVTKAFYAVFTTQELQAKHAQHSPIARLLGDDGGDDGKRL